MDSIAKLLLVLMTFTGLSVNSDSFQASENPSLTTIGTHTTGIQIPVNALSTSLGPTPDPTRHESITLDKFTVQSLNEHSGGVHINLNNHTDMSGSEHTEISHNSTVHDASSTSRQTLQPKTGDGVSKTIDKLAVRYLKMKQPVKNHRFLSPSKNTNVLKQVWQKYRYSNGWIDLNAFCQGGCIKGRSQFINHNRIDNCDKYDGGRYRPFGCKPTQRKTDDDCRHRPGGCRSGYYYEENGYDYDVEYLDRYPNGKRQKYADFTVLEKVNRKVIEFVAGFSFILQQMTHGWTEIKLPLILDEFKSGVKGMLTNGWVRSKFGLSWDSLSITIPKRIRQTEIYLYKVKFNLTIPKYQFGYEFTENVKESSHSNYKGLMLVDAKDLVVSVDTYVAYNHHPHGGKCFIRPKLHLVLEYKYDVIYKCLNENSKCQRYMKSIYNKASRIIKDIFTKSILKPTMEKHFWNLFAQVYKKLDVEREKLGETLCTLY